MGICEIITLIFVVLKLTGYIMWSWFWVLCPMYPALVCYLIFIVLWLIVFIKTIS